MKIIPPAINEIRAAMRTAAAAKSFALLIPSSNSGLTESDMASIELLKSSAMKTIPVTIMITVHSRVLTFRIIPVINAVIAAKKWILELCSFLISEASPLKAYLKLRSLDLREK